MTPRHDRNRRARLQRLGHDPAFQCPAPLATLGAIGASLGVHYAIGGHFPYGLCHPPIIAPRDDQRQALFAERLPIKCRARQIKRLPHAARRRSSQIETLR